MFVATEGLFGRFLRFASVAGQDETLRAEVVANDGPYEFVGGHGGELGQYCDVESVTLGNLRNFEILATAGQQNRQVP